MPLTIPSTTQEYIHVPLTEWSGDVDDPATLTAEIAIIPTDGEPASGDYVPASWVTEDGVHMARVLWQTAVESPLPRTVYRVWLRITSTPEVPVLLAGQIKTL